MKRIAKTAFPGKYAVKGNLRYIAVPANVIERMGLNDGDYLDVEISWPKIEEYEIDDIISSTEEKSKKPRRVNKEEE